MVATMCYEFYTTGKVNRYKFRYWFAIGLLNAFHLSLAVYFLATGDGHLQNARWATFALMEVLYLEIFINQFTFKKRRNELLLRVVFYYLVLLSPVLLFYPLNIAIASILSILAFKSTDELHNWFGVSFILYAFTTIIPEIFGYGSDISFFMGIMYMSHLFLGVYRLYKKENVMIGGKYGD
jgi:hypothetical protein